MFALFALSLVAGLAALARGRTFAGWSYGELRWWPLGLAALATEIVLASTPVGELPWAIQWGSAVWVAALAGMIAVLGRNACWRGGLARLPWLLASLGVGLNLLVVITNGGYMPQSQTARDEAGVSVERVAGLASRPAWHNVAPMSPDTRLPWLGDIFAEPAWVPSRNVVSLGDLLLSAGLAWATYLLAAPTGRAAVEPRRPRLPGVGRPGVVLNG
jgi:Family of unknown function (DUF5317)